MKALLQRVSRASVHIDGRSVGEISNGLLIFLGVMQGDTAADMTQLATKIPQLRLFTDNDGKMNLSLLETHGAALIVSQFTLGADCRKGRRPSFTDAAPPQLAEPLYDAFVKAIAGQGITVATGSFGASMQVELVNDGPVTIMLDSRSL